MTQPAQPAPPVTDPAGAPAAADTPPDGGSDGNSGPGDIAVVLMVPAEAAQALPSAQGDPEEEGGPVFLTLAYLTKPSTMDPPAFLIAVLTAVHDAAHESQPINGQINGLGRTSYDGTDDEFFALVESPDIEPLRMTLMQGLKSSAAADDANQPADGSAPNEVVDPGVYLPKIVLGTVGATDDLPVQRIDPTLAVFETLTLVQDGTLIDVPLGQPANSPDSPAQTAEQATANVGSTTVDTTAPNAATKAGGPPITRGTYVKVGSQQGRVDLVVTSGKVPGVDSDVTGSASNPAVRIVVYTESDGNWKATGKKIGASAKSCTRIAPLMKRPASKDAGYSALVGLLADHEAKVGESGLPGALPDGDALKTVYDRGVDAWPEGRTTMTAHDWAIGRVKAFLATAAGDRPDGYVRDDDLLPAEHPETKRRVTLDPAEVKARIEAQRKPAGV